jgi:hypothetical protein
LLEDREHVRRCVAVRVLMIVPVTADGVRRKEQMRLSGRRAAKTMWVAGEIAAPRFMAS